MAATASALTESKDDRLPTAPADAPPAVRTGSPPVRIGNPTCRQNADGSITQTFSKRFAKGVYAQCTLTVWPRRSRSVTMYVRDAKVTTVTVENLPDGSRVICRESDSGRSSVSRRDASGNRVG